MQRKTIFSPDRRYRYTLWREWDADNPAFVQFIGLNPSTADETKDDPTLRRCIGFAKAWGFGAVCVTNLFAYRSTDPAQLKKCHEPVGAKNDIHLIRIAREASVIVAAWGTHGIFQERNVSIIELIPNLQCLGMTKGGHPKHPLYIPNPAALRPLL